VLEHHPVFVAEADILELQLAVHSSLVSGSVLVEIGLLAQHAEDAVGAGEAELHDIEREGAHEHRVAKVAQQAEKGNQRPRQVAHRNQIQAVEQQNAVVTARSSGGK